jgi:hypothetical protein
MTKATRAQLVKSVLTSIVIYHATVFLLPKWLIKKIDKLRRIFSEKERRWKETWVASISSIGTLFEGPRNWEV